MTGTNQTAGNEQSPPNVPQRRGSPTKVTRHIGGSFCDPIDDETLDRYEALANASGDRMVESIMLDLIKMMRVFRETPDSKQPARPHPVLGQMVPLEEEEIERIWDHVPWEFECDGVGKVVESLPDGWRPVPDKDSPKGYRREVTDQKAFELKKAFGHLEWFARELAKDREPCTRDKL